LGWLKKNISIILISRFFNEDVIILKNTFAAIVVSFVVTHTMAADLFPDGKLRDIKSGDFIQSTDVVGGYSIFQNDGK